MLTTLLLAATLPARAVGFDAAALSAACDAGDAGSCLTLARARTGAGLPVDLLAARDAYSRACRLGYADGCQGEEGIGRLLGRHVDLHMLSSVPRVWALAGPLRVAAGQDPVPVEAPLAQALADRLPLAEACYAQAVGEAPGLEGQLDLSLLLAGGRVAELILHQASLADADVARCIVDAVGGARLPDGTADGEVFLRLRAEPAPTAGRNPPMLQDHLADGAQSTIGDPAVGVPPDDEAARRLEIAVTAAVRKRLADAPCVLDEVKSGRWDPVGLGVRLTVEPDGRASGVSVVAEPRAREELAMCVQQRLEDLSVGETGLDARVLATVTMRVAPLWTATWVP